METGVERRMKVLTIVSIYHGLNHLEMSDYVSKKNRAGMAVFILCPFKNQKIVFSWGFNSMTRAFYLIELNTDGK